MVGCLGGWFRGEDLFLQMTVWEVCTGRGFHAWIHPGLGRGVAVLWAIVLASGPAELTSSLCQEPDCRIRGEGVLIVLKENVVQFSLK